MVVCYKSRDGMKGGRVRPWISAGAVLLGGFIICMVPSIVSAACEDPPAPQVDWANCDKKSLTAQTYNRRTL